MKSTPFKGRVVMDIKKLYTFEDLFPRVEHFNFSVWRVIIAGKTFQWDDKVPINCSDIHLVARIGHWSNETYRCNNPIKLFQIK